MPNLAALLLGLYAAYYIVLEWFAGLTWTAFVALPVFVTANALQQVLRDAAPLSILDRHAHLPHAQPPPHQTHPAPLRL